MIGRRHMRGRRHRGVALITAMGIPVSFLFAAIALYYLGYTINMVSENH